MTIPFWTLHGTIDLAALRPQDMTAEILGATLAKINRLGGQPEEPWPVALHLCLVERLCPTDLQPWALLHDANTAFIGEFMSPALELICRHGQRDHIESAVSIAKGKLDRVIGHAWGVPVRSMNRTLREMDQIAVQAEAFAFLGALPEYQRSEDEEPYDKALTFIRELPDRRDWRSARDLWLSRVGHHTSLGLMRPPQP